MEKVLINHMIKVRYFYSDNFKGLTIRDGKDINIKLVGDRLNVETLLEHLDCFGIIELEKVKKDE